MSQIADAQQPLLAAKVNAPLTGEQINYALELIEQRHKLRDTPMRVVWPFLNYCCCCLFR